MKARRPSRTVSAPVSNKRTPPPAERKPSAPRPSRTVSAPVSNKPTGTRAGKGAERAGKGRATRRPSPDALAPREAPASARQGRCRGKRAPVSPSPVSNRAGTMPSAKPAPSGPRPSARKVSPPPPDCLATLLRRLPDWPEIPAFVVCSNLGISPYILRRLVRAGEVKTRLLRGRCLIVRESLARCLASRLTGPGGEAARAWIAALDRIHPRPE